MEKKFVNFDIAKKLQELNYPQELTETGYLLDDWDFYKKGDVANYKDFKTYEYHLCDRPTYFDVWVWLWNERSIQIIPEKNNIYIWPEGHFITNLPYKDLEKMIIEGVDYVFENNLID